MQLCVRNGSVQKSKRIASYWLPQYSPDSVVFEAIWALKHVFEVEGERCRQQQVSPEQSTTPERALISKIDVATSSLYEANLRASSRNSSQHLQEAAPLCDSVCSSPTSAENSFGLMWVKKGTPRVPQAWCRMSLASSVRQETNQKLKNGVMQ